MNKLNRHDIGRVHHAQKLHQGSPTAQRDFLEAIHVSLSQHDELVKQSVKSLELALAAMQNREAIPEGMAPLSCWQQK